MKFFIFILSSLLAFPVIASPLPDFPFVAVTGTSSKRVQPDSALVSFYINTFSKNSLDAGKQLKLVSEKVLMVTKQLSIPRDDITSFEINKDTKRKRDNNYNSLEILGYEFSREFTIRLDNLKNYPALIDKLLDIDNLHSISTEFDTSKRHEIEVTLVAEAAKNARNKATIMAKGLNVNISSVFAFNDSGSFNTFFGTFGISNDFGLENIVVRGLRASEASQAIIPKSIELNKSINVIYKLK